MPEDLFTLLIQRAILGVESYLPYALTHAAGALGKLDAEFVKKLKAPSSFGAKNMAANIYHRMPEAVHTELSLKWLDQHLYEEIVAFYRDVRNPVFHGKQLRCNNIDPIRNVFSLIESIYSWIDHWHNPDVWHNSKVKLGALAINLPTFVNRRTKWLPPEAA